jgi:hypothetical protein
VIIPSDPETLGVGGCVWVAVLSSGLEDSDAQRGGQGRTAGVVPIVATEKNYRKDLDIVNAPFFHRECFGP